MLYLYNTLNNTDFKSGRYVEFESYTDENSINISKYIKEGGVLNYYPKFYKVKLLHQLSNGYLDLTKDIWTKFLAVSRNTSTWFANTSFKYYCPSKYKGKLVSILEIEDLYKFSLWGLPTINYDVLTETYSLSLGMDVISLDPSYYSSDGCITVPKLKLETWINDPTQPNTPIEETTAYPHSILDTYKIGDIVYQETTKNKVKTRLYYKNLTGNNSDLTVSSNWESYNYLTLSGIDKSNKDSFINYRITPILSTLGGTTLYKWDSQAVNSDLPDEFINKYKVEGKIRITTDYENITFTRVNSNFTCDLVRGVKIYNEYILANKNGTPVNENLEITDEPLIFLREGTQSQTLNSTIINPYIVSNRKPELGEAVTIVDDFILDLFKITEVEETSDCVESNNFTLTMNFNINLSNWTLVKLYQNDELIFTSTGVTTNTLEATVNSIDDIVIRIYRPGYKSINITKSKLTQDSTVNLAFIADINIYRQSDNEYQVSWKGLGETLPQFSYNAILYTLITYSYQLEAILAKVSDTIMRSGIFTNSTDGNLVDLIFAQDGSTDIPRGTYLNIDSDQAVLYEGTIFNKHPLN